MRRFTCSSALLAVVLAGYGVTVHAQESCQSEVQELRSQLEGQRIADPMKQAVRTMLDQAEAGSEQDCQAYLATARQHVERAQSSGEVQTGSTMTQGTASDVPTPDPSSTSDERATPQASDTTQVQVDQAPAAVEVDAAAPQVKVQQRPPQVTVQQQPPEVTIEQPEADVTVRQAKPEVTVNQAEPDVTIEQAEPEVTVRQAGEPEVRLETAGDAQARSTSRSQEPIQGNQDAAQESSTAVSPTRERQEPATAAVPNPMAESEQSSGGTSTDLPGSSAQQTASSAVDVGSSSGASGRIRQEEAVQLIGKTATSPEGEEVGEISAVVRSRDSHELHAVADVGGFFGLGERTVAIPLNQADIGPEGNLQLRMTREQIENMPEYDPQAYIAMR